NWWRSAGSWPPISASVAVRFPRSGACSTATTPLCCTCCGRFHGRRRAMPEPRRPRYLDVTVRLPEPWVQNVVHRLDISYNSGGEWAPPAMVFFYVRDMGGELAAKYLRQPLQVGLDQIPLHRRSDAERLSTTLHLPVVHPDGDLHMASIDASV